MAVVGVSVPGSAEVSVLPWRKPSFEAVTAALLYLVFVSVETSVLVFVVVAIFWGLKPILVGRTSVLRGLRAER